MNDSPLTTDLSDNDSGAVLCTSCGRDVMKDCNTKVMINSYTYEMQKTYTECNILNSSDFSFNCPYNRSCRPMTLHISHRIDKSILKFQVIEVYGHSSSWGIWESIPIWAIAAATISIALSLRHI